MGLIGCPETSARNYQYWLRNSPLERSSHLLHGGGLTSRIVDGMWGGYVDGTSLPSGKYAVQLIVEYYEFAKATDCGATVRHICRVRMC